MVSAAERKKQIMQKLSIRRFDTMENLAAEFNVSTRTIQRDIEDLSISEPLYTKAGRHNGGVYVTDDYSYYKEYFDEDIILLIKKLILYCESKKSYHLSDEERSSITKLIVKHTKPKKER